MKNISKRVGLTLLVLFVFAVSVLSALNLSPKVYAATANDTESSTVSIEVASKTMIDITPASFSWGPVDPGTVADSSDETNSYGKMQIENIGSTNITKVWFNVTQPTQRPFGTGNKDLYDTGNFISIAREGSSDFYFVDRLEFNETRELVYLTGVEGNTPPGSNSVYGRFRNASKEYFWMVDITSGTTCTDLTMRIGNTARTRDQTGTTDFSNGGGDYTELGSLTDTGNGYCYADISTGGTNPLDGYTVYVDETSLSAANTPEVHLSKWNLDLEGTQDASNTESFYSGTIYPGNSTVAQIQAHLPYGVAEGEVQQGDLTVLASTV
ncbi:MAG: hypothetical protein ABEK17_00095 [Candidatus Aenigmatarchaeota archaeon]